MRISLIACVTSDMCIGVDGQLLIPLKPDLEHFKMMTTGHVIVMGKNTYMSLPDKNPLPNRTNVIISTSMKEAPEGFQLYKSVNDFINDYREYDGEIFVIGGAQIYDAFMPFAEKVYLTHVHRDGMALLAEEYPDYYNVTRFPDSVYDYKWDIRKSVDEVCLDRKFGIVHYNFLTLHKLYAK